jgi:hypothetical protein
LTELEKRGYVSRDDLESRYVDYMGVLAQVKPKAQTRATSSSFLTKAVVRIQSAWRARQARREAARRRHHAADGLEEVGDVIEALRANDTEKLARATSKGPKGTGSGRQDPKAKDGDRKRKDGAGRSGRDRPREGESIETKMAAVIRPGKEGRLNDRAL